MAVSYSRQAPLKEALQMTFDGAHPCHLCQAVAEGKKSEQKGESLKLQTKLDVFCLGARVSFHLPTPFSALCSTGDIAVTRTKQPPTPPPRPA